MCTCDVNRIGLPVSILLGEAFLVLYKNRPSPVRDDLSRYEWLPVVPEPGYNTESHTDKFSSVPFH
jgi:hypothetical protein